jgi:predicted O-linked N-acetylglucosamine transferase (SPINDLY family)
MKTAASLGVNAQRLVFGQRMEASEYLARYKSADLFLDTHPYNAGTTASDALWVGLPGITRIGKSFASRMAASALMGVGLEELITQTPEDYEDLAIKLGTNAAFYQSIQDKLKRQKDQAPLFNTEKFTRHLETALEQVVHHARAGLSPQTLRPNPSC